METEILDTIKKRKNDASSEDAMTAKRRKIEIDDMEDTDDICIIENNDALHDTSSELKKSTAKKRKSSENTDCLIVYDDNHSD